MNKKEAADLKNILLYTGLTILFITILILVFCVLSVIMLDLF